MGESDRAGARARPPLAPPESSLVEEPPLPLVRPSRIGPQLDARLSSRSACPVVLVLADGAERSVGFASHRRAPRP